MLKQLTITIVTGLFALIITANAQELNPTYWSDAPSKTPKSKGLEVIKADAYRTVKIDLPELRKALSKASSVNNKQKENSVQIDFYQW